MNPCEEYELLLSARLDGALSLKEETQLHAHLAQCPHCRQLAQELEDLQTQMPSPWVEPPDSLKDALASQDWSKSASSSPPRSPTASPSKRRHLLPWLACAAAASLEKRGTLKRTSPPYPARCARMASRNALP